MTKRILSILLALALLPALCACGAETAVPEEPAAKPAEVEPTEAPEPEESLPPQEESTSEPEESLPPQEESAPATPAPTEAQPAAEAEASFVGEWTGVYAYNAAEKLIRDRDELDILLSLNGDLSAILLESGQTLAFSWHYTETENAAHNPSVQYMHFECVPDPDAVIPDTYASGDFYFEVDTKDENTIYMTFGGWLLLFYRQ